MTILILIIVYLLCCIGDYKFTQLYYNEGRKELHFYTPSILEAVAVFIPFINFLFMCAMIILYCIIKYDEDNNKDIIDSFFKLK